MRILEVCVDLDGGGIDRYLLNYCSRIRDIQFDFAIVENNKTGILEKEIEALGSRIYRVPRQSQGIRANYHALKKILTQTQYDAVHVHLGYRGALALLCAKNCGIKTRIVHAHIAYETEGFVRKCVRKVFTVITKTLATHLAACGVEAGKWVWGASAYNSGKVKIHNNAIDTQKFRFRENLRQQKRRELGLGENTVAVGHVGRICAQKNQSRLIDIFAQMHQMRPDSRLFIIGRGDSEKALLQKVRSLGLEDHVQFMGVRSDVHELLNAFDVFVFPSLYEGLPFTLIETQCNGLPAICSDTVTSLVKVGSFVRFMGLEATNQEWAVCALEVVSRENAADAWQDVVAEGYDIDTEARVLEEYYKNSAGSVK